MMTKLPFRILPQPDETTCGSTCLHYTYSYYGAPLPLEQVISEVAMLEAVGTLAVLLANHALRRGKRATIFTYRRQIFDPTWLTDPDIKLAAKLRAQMTVKNDSRLQDASHGSPANVPASVQLP